MGHTRKARGEHNESALPPNSRQQRGRHPSANHSEISTFCYLVAPITIGPKGSGGPAVASFLASASHLRDPVAKWVTLQALLVRGDDVFGSFTTASLI
jgi:hypothetical protein